MSCTHTPSYATAPELDIANEFMWGQAREIHGSNVVAGWWTDPKTGESIVETRNRGEIMMLVVSELAEAAEGVQHDLPDDKLPDFPMYDVELADTAIRLLDLLGVEEPHAPDSGFSTERMMKARRELAVLDNRQSELMLCVRKVATAMEHHRKGRKEPYVSALWEALEHVVGLAQLHNIQLFAVMAAKRGFNAVREDHKLENRVRDGGKAY